MWEQQPLFSYGQASAELAELREELPYDKGALAGFAAANHPEPYDHFVRIAIRSIREAEHWVFRWYGATLEEVRLRKAESGILVIVKAIHKGKPVVSFLHAETLSSGIIALGLALATKTLSWRPDQYPTRVRG